MSGTSTVSAGSVIDIGRKDRTNKNAVEKESASTGHNINTSAGNPVKIAKTHRQCQTDNSSTEGRAAKRLKTTNTVEKESESTGNNINTSAGNPVKIARTHRQCQTDNSSTEGRAAKRLKSTVESSNSENPTPIRYNYEDYLSNTSMNPLIDTVTNDSDKLRLARTFISEHALQRVVSEVNLLKSGKQSQVKKLTADLADRKAATDMINLTIEVMRKYRNWTECVTDIPLFQSVLFNRYLLDHATDLALRIYQTSQSYEPPANWSLILEDPEEMTHTFDGPARGWAYCPRSEANKLQLDVSRKLYEIYEKLWEEFIRALMEKLVTPDDRKCLEENFIKHKDSLESFILDTYELYLPTEVIVFFYCQKKIEEMNPAQSLSVSQYFHILPEGYERTPSDSTLDEYAPTTVVNLESSGSIVPASAESASLLERMVCDYVAIQNGVEENTSALFSNINQNDPYQLYRSVLESRGFEMAAPYQHLAAQNQGMQLQNSMNRQLDSSGNTGMQSQQRNEVYYQATQPQPLMLLTSQGVNIGAGTTNFRTLVSQDLHYVVIDRLTGKERMKRIPSAGIVFLPRGFTSDWKTWNDAACLEWAFKFVTDHEHRQFLAKEKINFSYLEVIETEDFGSSFLRMPRSLFATIRNHFRSVINSYHGFLNP